jgi:hypothetical protein
MVRRPMSVHSQVRASGDKTSPCSQKDETPARATNATGVGGTDGLEPVVPNAPGRRARGAQHD